MVSDFTPEIQHFAFFMTFSRIRSYSTDTLLYLRKDFHGHQSHQTLSSAIIFCAGGGGGLYFTDRVFKNIRTQFRNWKLHFQLEIEAISTETLTKVLNNFVLRLHKIRALRRHHTEHVFVQQSPSVWNDLWKFRTTAFNKEEVIHMLKCQMIKKLPVYEIVKRSLHLYV
jgi:hypothetical protein